MNLPSAKLYFNNEHLADIDIVSYQTPFFLGRHSFFDNDLEFLLVRISEFDLSDIWLDDELNDDEQEKKLDDLQKSLNISDEELNKYYYRHRDNWFIVMEDGKKYLGFPHLDQIYIQWR